MKKSEHYIKQIKQLFTRLRKERVKTVPPAAASLMEELLHGILATYASDTKADAALHRLREALVDLNEMRVSSVAELVGILGTDYPGARPAAQEIVATLNAVFNRTHALDLANLKNASIKSAETFLGSLDGLGHHARSWFLLRCLGARVMPIDQNMLAFLRRSGCVQADAGVEEVQKLLTGQVSDRDLLSMYLTLKRHAAAHTPRKTVSAKETVTKKAEPEPAAREEAAAAVPRAVAKPAAVTKAALRPPAPRRPSPKPPPPKKPVVRPRSSLKSHRGGKKSR